MEISDYINESKSIDYLKGFKEGISYIFDIIALEEYHIIKEIERCEEIIGNKQEKMS